MASHADVDEPSRSGYLLCAVVILPADVTAIRRTLRTLRKAGSAEGANGPPVVRREGLSGVQTERW